MLVVEGADVQARERRGANEMLAKATAGRFHGLKSLPPVRPSTAVVTPRARLACRLDVKMRTPAMV
jgi:hypothetical protein